jgi:hypothetical protein
VCAAGVEVVACTVREGQSSITLEVKEERLVALLDQATESAKNHILRTITVAGTHLAKP